MKKFLLHTLFIILTSTLVVAQQFPPTFNSICTNCVPLGYSIASGSPSISDPVGVGGQSQKAWIGSVPNPPSYTYDANTKKTFVSLENNSIKKDKIKTTVGGFVAGYEYTLRYFVMSSRTSATSYGTEAELRVVTLDAVPAIISSKKTIFVPGSNVNIWIEEAISFTATANQLSFVFSGSASSGSSGFVNFDISGSPFDCKIPGGQVQLFRSSVNSIFPCAGANLYSLIKSATPAGSKAVWRNSNNYVSALPNLSVEEASNAGVGKYWAFYATDEGCKNAYTSIASVDVKWTQTQVPLKANKLTVNSPAANPKGDLTSLLDNPIADVRWSKSLFPTDANVIADPTAVSPGVYYAYYYISEGNCYSLDINNNTSTAKVTVEADICNAGTNQVAFKGNAISLTNQCPATVVDLNALIEGVLPLNCTYRWYSNDSHVGTELPNPTTLQVPSPGVNYFAFIYDEDNHCYNTDKSTAKIFVHRTLCNPCPAGTSQVTLKATSATNICPKQYVDLGALTTGLPPSNCGYVWYSTANHVPGTEVTSSSAVGSGTYYAFIRDTYTQCFNTDSSTSAVTVSQIACNNVVNLNLKVSLQGAMPANGGLMKNELQMYGGYGLLPIIDPYGSGANVEQINNGDNLGGLGLIVDWIQIEVRDASAPATILESQSLLLRPDGVVIDYHGNTPAFASQPVPVMLAIKHRNHLAIMSNPIQNFSAGSTINYDFTTALSQASNAFGDPPQMVQKNGIWCMWAGDVNGNQDLGIDASDSNEVYKSNKEGSSYDIYIMTDLNMDGGVDSNDRNLIYLSNLTGSISTIVNY